MSKSQALMLRSNALIEFDGEKLALIKKTYGKDLSDAEFGLYMAVAKSKGLDPVLGQVHAVKRNDGNGGKAMTIQVGIDGYRLIAARTNQHGGTDPIQYKYRSDKLHEAVCTVYRIVSGTRVSYTASAMWNEYYPGEKMGFMWRKMPETMLGKCAEAKALRMAFPGDLGGLYVEEEMHQTFKDVTPKEEVKTLNERFSDEPAQTVEIKAHCEICKSELIKSRNKPWYYCPNWQDKEAKHSNIKESEIEGFAEKQKSQVEVKDEPAFDGNFSDEENPFK